MSKKTTTNNSPKRQFELLQTRKLISAYGGVGSIVETPIGAIKIKNFDEWTFFKKEGHKNPENHIEDTRLIARLQKWFPKLEQLIRVPIGEIDNSGYASSLAETTAGEYFPKWMFCPSCRHFDRLEHWHSLWLSNTYEKHKLNFHPPKCAFCYKKSKGKRFQGLEQVRFILFSSNGRIADIPWDRWVFAQIQKAKNTEVGNKEEQDEESKKHRELDFSQEIPTDVFYKYETSDKLSDLAGINIIAYNKKTEKEVKRATLSGIFNLRVKELDILPNVCSNSVMKVVIRSSNSVYYPNILQSLFLPVQKSTITETEKSFIKNGMNSGLTIPKIQESLKLFLHKDFSIERLESLIENNFQEGTANQNSGFLENEFRYNEYICITSKIERHEDIERKLIIEPVPAENVGIEFLKLFRIDRLKMTSVQTSYTRQEPIDRDYFLTEDQRTEGTMVTIRKRYTSKYGKETFYLPAVESYGEGIFIEFDKNVLENWQKQHPSVLERVAVIQSNYNSSRGFFESRTIQPKFVLIHTFAHLLIKELEFLCGYPMTSLQERLYVSADMQGVLIYTMAGSEGSYGGLTSLCRSTQIGQVIKSALYRAKDCTSDPICYHTDNTGQGFGGTNLAACYSCALLPETSCEEFNRFLDRGGLIDVDFGFFKN